MKKKPHHRGHHSLQRWRSTPFRPVPVIALLLATVWLLSGSTPADATSRGDTADEMFFYRDDGLFRYYNIKPNGEIGKPILAGTNYTKGWTSITSVQLDDGTPPSRPEKVSTTWTCTWSNPDPDQRSCIGDIDTLDASEETWNCWWSSLFDWFHCTGNIDKTDASQESWICTWGDSFGWYQCQGNTDKADDLDESWTCTHKRDTSERYECTGNIDKSDSAEENWTCTWDEPSGKWTCSGDIDKAISGTEGWTCVRDATRSRFDCEGSASSKIPPAFTALLPPGAPAEYDPT